ncbi:MAG TPA: HtaA domain-containing protein [Solirubrobacterales bacterium]
MSSDESNNRVGRAAVALAVLVASTAAMAASASAAPGQGTAAIGLAEHGKGRTLSGQGVKVLAGSPATRTGNDLSLPISAVDPGAEANATADGWLRFKRGKKGATLTGLRFDLAAETLSGKLDDEEIAVFKLGGTTVVDSSTGNIALNGGKLRLTAIAALALRDKLRLPRALKRSGVGTLSLSAKANPVLAAARPVVSGGATWGVRSALRGYILSPPTGTISVAEGATANGPLTSPATAFGFPAASGISTRGLYGAASKLALRIAGSVTFAKPEHCIEALRFDDIEVRIDGADSAITVDATFDQGAPCPDEAPVTTEDVELGKLDPSGVSPVYSADGQTVTWTAIPATVTPAGAIAFGGFLKAGAELDPITISLGLG